MATEFLITLFDMHEKKRMFFSLTFKRCLTKSLILSQFSIEVTIHWYQVENCSSTRYALRNMFPNRYHDNFIGILLYTRIPFSWSKPHFLLSNLFLLVSNMFKPRHLSRRCVLYSERVESPHVKAVFSHHARKLPHLTSGIDLELILFCLTVEVALWLFLLFFIPPVNGWAFNVTVNTSVHLRFHF